VSADSRGIELQTDPDVRLAAAAGGAARYFAESAGMLNEAATELQKSVVAACQEAFEHLIGDHPRLVARVELFKDRIEIELTHEGRAQPSVGLDRIAGFADQLGGSNGLGGVDRVQYEAHDGLSVTRLTKYLGKPPAT
jgi:hypothetical protein